MIRTNTMFDQAVRDRRSMEVMAEGNLGAGDPGMRPWAVELTDTGERMSPEIRSVQ